MKAIVQDKYGSADVLELQEIDKPVVKDDGVLVRVQAASANPLDWHIMRGRPFIVRMMSGLRQPKPRVRGVDVAGQVEAVGKDVTEFQPGDEVFGWCQGAFAEYVTAGEANFLTKPTKLTPEQAATVGVAGFTALQGLRDKGKIESGHKVLIIGASGGVGTFAVQIAKSFGAEVTGVCSTRNVDMLRSIDADHVIDYTAEDFTKGHQRYDLIFQLAGTASPAKLRRVLTPKGTLVLTSGEGRMAGIDRIIKALVVSPFVSQTLVAFLSKTTKEDLLVLGELVGSGEVTPVIDRTYPLREAPAAVDHVGTRHTQGKTVIAV